MNDPDSARRWLENQLLLNLARFEAPLLLAHCQAAAQDDWPRLLHLAAEHRASRETRELQLESRQMGYSLAQLLDGLPELDQPGRDCRPPPTSPAWPWPGAGRPCPADRTCRCTGRRLWGWLENQLAVLMKTLPLGQQAAQRLTSRCCRS